LLKEWREKMIILRKEVKEFAQAMELTLRKHDPKKGKDSWKKDSYGSLFMHLSEEVQETMEATHPHEIEKEAIDVANMAMMIWDNARTDKNNKDMV
jgi:NTP pyrophosphatase (non-canonical NTP hydrolase)